MNKLKLILKSGATLLFCLLLQACATTPQPRVINAWAKNVLAPEKQEEKLYPVVISIGFNTGMNFQTLVIESLSEKTLIQKNNKTYRMGMINPGVSRSTLIYSGKLPVGEYRIVELSNSVSSSNPTMVRGASKFIKLDEQNKADYIGTFKVAEDTTTDLGRMFLTHVNDAYIFSRSENYPSNKELVAKFGDKYLQAIYKDKVLTGWTRPITAIEKHFGNESKLLPYGMQCFKETSENRVVAASKTGAIFSFSLTDDIKDKKEKAKILHSKDGLAFECLTIKQNSSFDFLAYGEMNSLYKHQKGSDVLSPVDTGNLPIGVIVSVSGNETSGWFIEHFVGINTTIYHSDRLEKGDWKPVEKRQTVINGMPDYFRIFWTWEDKSGFGYANMNGEINYYDYRVNKWYKTKTPDNKIITQLASSPDQTLSMLLGMGDQPYLTKDHGTTWEKLEMPFPTNYAAPKLSIQGDIYAVNGGFLRSTKLAVSHDHGKTWEYYPDVMAPASITVLNSGILLSTYAWNDYALVKVSEDKGKTWRLIYTTYNPKLNELIKK
ncbi:BNR/Asp-box repeat protein [Acinetobacter sp. WC-323]|uniref:sialidase family protein n=1 Tax=Acinetobacter sp. WC-323 TaxID=903918 RepID=UPI00029E5BFF|nr:sialidase family protein [Acinetobacter sp. WC-323]EKU55011.1 BNR/Asp-box repeat protein [Acinetobacter sp. WC-323]